MNAVEKTIPPLIVNVVTIPNIAIPIPARKMPIEFDMFQLMLPIEPKDARILESNS